MAGVGGPDPAASLGAKGALETELEVLSAGARPQPPMMATQGPMRPPHMATVLHASASSASPHVPGPVGTGALEALGSEGLFPVT